MKKIFLALTISFISLSVISQEIYNLTLEESIEVAKEKSYNMLQLAQDMKIAEYNLKSTTSRLKTHITLNLTLPNYEETIKSKTDDVIDYYSVKQLSYSGNLRINQPLPTDGNIYVQSNLSTLKDYYKFARSSDFRTRIGFSQPLDILYGFSQIRTDLKNAELTYERSSKIYKRQEMQLILDVSRSFYNLLALQKRKEIALSNLERQKDAYEISKNKYEAGLIREVDALQMEVDLAEAQNGYDVAIYNESASINIFKELLGIDLNDSLTLKNQMNYRIIDVNVETAVDYALKNRMELQEQDIQIEMTKLSIKQQKTKGLPRGSVDAYYDQIGYNTSGDMNIGNSISNSFKDFKDRGPSFGVGFSVSIPILDFGENRALVRAAEARLKNNEYEKEMRKRSIETSVRNLTSEIYSNLKRLQLLEKNVSVAEKSFEITLQRFSDGDIDSQALALERNRLNNAYTTHLSAYIDYQLSLVQLQRETLYDFEKNQPVL